MNDISAMCMDRVRLGVSCEGIPQAVATHDALFSAAKVSAIATQNRPSTPESETAWIPKHMVAGRQRCHDAHRTWVFDNPVHYFSVFVVVVVICHRTDGQERRGRHDEQQVARTTWEGMGGQTMKDLA